MDGSLFYNNAKAAFRFCKYLVQANPGLARGFDQWIFLPGMIFGSRLKWWGGGGLRAQAHEGIDFCLYHNTAGRLCRLSADTRVAVAGDGIVVQIVDDFLGRSVFVHHPCFDRASHRLISAYGHIRPCDPICSGRMVSAGEIIGTIAPVSRKKRLFAHVHVSFLWAPAAVDDRDLRWDRLTRDLPVEFIDPLGFMHCRCQSWEGS